MKLITSEELRNRSWKLKKCANAKKEDEKYMKKFYQKQFSFSEEYLILCIKQDIIDEINDYYNHLVELKDSDLEKLSINKISVELNRPRAYAELSTSEKNVNKTLEEIKKESGYHFSMYQDIDKEELYIKLEGNENMKNFYDESGITTMLNNAGYDNILFTDFGLIITSYL